MNKENNKIADFNTALKLKGFNAYEIDSTNVLFVTTIEKIFTKFV